MQEVIRRKIQHWLRTQEGTVAEFELSLKYSDGSVVSLKESDLSDSGVTHADSTISKVKPYKLSALIGRFKRFGGHPTLMKVEGFKPSTECVYRLVTSPFSHLLLLEIPKEQYNHHNSKELKVDLALRGYDWFMSSDEYGKVYDLTKFTRTMLYKANPSMLEPGVYLLPMRKYNTLDITNKAKDFNNHIIVGGEVYYGDD